jgi:acyl carrier protein
MINEKPLLIHSIREKIISYVLENHISEYTQETLPLDKSLYELEVLDSIAIVELIDFIETNWSIVIEDTEITTEELGSINKMADLICKKL